LLTYTRETAVVEKLEAMVKLGIANSRMKDFYDLEVLPRFAFQRENLADAILNTFVKVGCKCKGASSGQQLGPTPLDDANKVGQWIDEGMDLTYGQD
jgi:hypothetical protein